MTQPTAKFVPPRRVRIPPRGEAMVRFVNDLILHNLRGDAEETKLILPPLVERAYNVVYETTTIELRNYPEGIVTRNKQ